MTFTSLDLHGAPLHADGLVAPRRRLTLASAVLLHGTVAAGLLLAPLLGEQALPEPAGARAFLVAMPDQAPPPPPPPPPAVPRSVAPQPRPSVAPTQLVAPVEVPDRIADDSSDISAFDSGVPGGVEGGVDGGVAGGVVGGLGEAPPPEERVVRVGGMVHAPRVLRDVQPVYPPYALAAHANGLAILELHVGRDGRVKEVSVLRADPLFGEAAVEAAWQRLYQPLLLDGVPTDFVITVTIRFAVKPART